MAMRLHIPVEGHTEERFVKEVLAPPEDALELELITSCNEYQEKELKSEATP